ncbi:MAG: threonylcarbamoyl-AMP synthase [Piscirickettsiaceae bacterium]|jgi:L-threonylcarbamoyladenylate synthase|nr:threonylcarbamoyl-AMP synthase [Piscirickettsiaceae bacterium]
MNYWSIRQAVKTLRSGGVIAYPTEAVFGLGCDPWDEAAVNRILDIKQRPWHKGLILIASDFNQLADFIEPLSPETLQQIEATWPGPVTWLLPAKDTTPDYLTGEHATIAVRITAHPIAHELCKAAGHALVSTSANIAGMPPAKNHRQVRWQLPEVNAIVTGHCGEATQPSQIRDAQTGTILR